MAQRKDVERARARELRADGLSLREIGRRLGVSYSSVSLWVRDVAVPPPAALDPVRDGSVRDEPVRDEPVRRCPKCAQDLPASSFSRAGDGYQHWCKSCFRAYFRARGARHREQAAASRKERRRRAVERLLDVLRSTACADCGEDEILVLEFDHHLGEKEANIANLLAAAARFERLERELARCEVVCANCHRRRTARRAGTFRLTGVVPRSWTRAQERNQRFVLDHLRRSPCVDCGERDPVVLEFDHVGEKRAMVTRLATWSSLERLQEEIAQCEVRCVSCHRLRTLSAGPTWRDATPWAAT